MKKMVSVNIIGCGIVGLVSALVIKKFLPECKISVFDAGGHPQDAGDLVGTTFGKGRDARQFTGSESLSFQNPVHSRALRLAPNEHENWAGWRVISENNLTNNEKRWRSESTHRFVEIGHENLNYYDELHAQFNYAGIKAWEILISNFPQLIKHKISDGPVEIFFLSKKNFEDDLESETYFLREFGDTNNTISAANAMSGLLENISIYKKNLKLPGSSWRIRSLGIELISDLEKMGVNFHWNKEITETKSLEGDFIIWTVGTTHALPDIYKKYSLIQGIAGCWVSIPNKGFTKPFKISVEQPSGYINITPDGDVLHISGGFGWVGERPYEMVWGLMKPVIEHFKRQINKFFGISIQEMDVDGKFPVSVCIRPSSPTGLPDTRVIEIENKKHIILTGSGKSGSTQAALLGLYAATELNSNSVKIYLGKNKAIERAIKKLKKLHKIHKFTASINYPDILEKDLFGGVRI